MTERFDTTGEGGVKESSPARRSADVTSEGTPAQSPSSTSPPAAVSQRHHTTVLAWEWLEHGEGLKRDEEQRARIREALENIDRVFLEWDEPRPPAQFPASVYVHWPSGPVACCPRHGEQLVGLGNFMGAHVVMSLLPAQDIGFIECVNCVNEGPPE